MLTLFFKAEPAIPLVPLMEAQKLDKKRGRMIRQTKTVRF